MSVAGAEVELLVPRLFGDAPIILPTNGIAVCKPEEMEKEALPAGARHLDIASLQKTRQEANLLMVVAQRMLFPPVRFRARFGPEGFLFHRARARPHDGYGFHCVDRERVIAELTRHGVEQTNVPYAWVTTRRARALLEP